MAMRRSLIWGTTRIVIPDTLCLHCVHDTRICAWLVYSHFAVWSFYMYFTGESHALVRIQCSADCLKWDIVPPFLLLNDISWRGKHIYMHARTYHSPREAYIYAHSTMRTIALLLAYLSDDRYFSLRDEVLKGLSLTASIIIDNSSKG